MPKGPVARARDIIKSGSLKRWEKPPETFEDERDPEDIDDAERELDQMLGRPTSIDEENWQQLERQVEMGQRMIG